MTDNRTRHVISFLMFLAGLVLFGIGYAAGVFGWWWSFPVTLLVYVIIFKLVEA